MSKILRIGIDLDGVLADFIKCIVKIMREKVGIDLPEDFKPAEWHWGDVLPKHAMSDAWKIIDNTPDFWETLEPLPDIAFMKEFFKAHAHKGDIYFITARKNGKSPVSAKQQSENWLYRHLDYPLSPITVMTVHSKMNKLPIIKALGIDYFVDDHGLTIQKLTETQPEVKSFLLAQSWNVPERNGVRVIHSIAEFFDEIRKAG